MRQARPRAQREAQRQASCPSRRAPPLRQPRAHASSGHQREAAIEIKALELGSTGIALRTTQQVTQHRTHQQAQQEQQQRLSQLPAAALDERESTPALRRRHTTGRTRTLLPSLAQRQQHGQAQCGQQCVDTAQVQATRADLPIRAPLVHEAGQNYR